MKRVLGVALMLAVLILFAAFTGAIASTTISGTSGNDWRTWGESDLGQDGNPYWEGVSADGNTSGNQKGIGYYLTNTGAFGGGSGPGAIPYWGSEAGGYDPNFYFNKTGAGYSATLKIEIAGNAGANRFGWYDRLTGDKTELFIGDDGENKMISFSPTTAYGFYLIALNGDTYYTEYPVGTRMPLEVV